MSSRTCLEIEFPYIYEQWSIKPCNSVRKYCLTYLFKAGFKRITAYCIAETFKMKLLASFLKREHNVLPRVFDEALYAVRPISLCCIMPLMS